MLHPSAGLTFWPVAGMTRPFAGFMKVQAKVYGGWSPEADATKVQETFPVEGAIQGVFETEIDPVSGVGGGGGGGGGGRGLVHTGWIPPPRICVNTLLSAVGWSHPPTTRYRRYSASQTFA